MKVLFPDGQMNLQKLSHFGVRFVFIFLIYQIFYDIFHYIHSYFKNRSKITFGELEVLTVIPGEIMI